MKTTFKLCFLFLVIVFAACQKDTSEMSYDMHHDGINSASTRGPDANICTPLRTKVSNATTETESIIPAKELEWDQKIAYWATRAIYDQIDPYGIPVKTGDATTTYNCHGYAWAMGGGSGSPVWINLTPMAYIDDGSYIRIHPGNVVNGDIVRYPDATDHSAIAITADIFESKWAEGPVVRHHKDYSPFGSAGIEFYRRINVPSNLNSLAISGDTNTTTIANVTYNVPANPSTDFTFKEWSVTPSSYTLTSGTLKSNPLNIKFNSGTQYTIKAIYNLPVDYLGNRKTYEKVTMQVTVTYINPIPTLPAPQIYAGAYLPGGGRTLHVSSSSLPASSGYDLEWADNGNIFASGYGPGFTSVDWYPDNPGSGNSHAITCRIRLTGGQWSDWSYTEWVY